MSTRTHVFEAGDGTLNAGGSPAVRAAISAYWTQVFGCPEEFSTGAAAERSVGRTDGLLPSARAYRPRPPHAHNSILRRIVRLRPHTAQSPQARDSAPRLPTVAIVPIAEINDAAKRALEAALAMRADEVIAVHVCDRRRRSATRRFEQEWDDWNPNVTMVFLDGREDSVATPILEYVQRTYARKQIFVFITHDHRIHASDNGITHHHANQLENTFRHEPNIVICRTPTLH